MVEGAPFDAGRYKTTTREQWQTAAEAWDRWGPTLSTWLGPATETMLDMARVRRGVRVLDVAAGAGEQTIAAARRVGPAGFVLATDISPNILTYAAAAARSAGLTNIETAALDAEALDSLPDASFDAVICRLGLIYFPDQIKALRGMHRALRPGGRFAAIVFSKPENNRFFSAPVAIIRRVAQLPPPTHGQPGPFSLGATGALERLLEEAGFKSVEGRVVPAPLHLASAAECVRFERESFGALHQMLSSVDNERRDAIWQEIEKDLAQFNGDHGFEGPCELVIGAGVK